MGNLQDMLDKQAWLQSKMDQRATSEDPQTQVEYFKDMSLAGIAEIIEMMEETGWKPWSSSWHINLEAARGEWIDAWHFLMNCANTLNMDERIITHLYFEKARVNEARANGTYDGKSTKCLLCKRALDDISVRCYAPSGNTSGWCAETNFSYKKEI